MAPLLRQAGRLAALLKRRAVPLRAGASPRGFSSSPPPPPPPPPSPPPPPFAPLCFVAESHYLASPDKTNGGEDALFASRYALAVADGVGGWSDQGVDSGHYARALLAAARAFCEAAVERGERPCPMAALESAHAAVRLKGSSTACLAVAGRGGAVEVANVGDSGLQVWRRARPQSLLPAAPLRLEEAALLWEPRFEAPQQQHYFNCPLQLSASPASDAPRQGARADAPVEPGDLVILGTDGLWDNLAERDVRALLARVDFTACTQLARMSRARFAEAQRAERALALGGDGSGGSGGGGGAASGAASGAEPPLERLKLLGLAPEVAPSTATFAAKERECRAQLSALAHLLTAAAIRVGRDEASTTTPFAVNARKAGQQWRGGKLDDTAVIVAIALADDSHFDLFA
jgi:protein phosphatase PTC7